MKKLLALAVLHFAVAGVAHAADAGHHPAQDPAVAAQNAALEQSTEGKGYGPQSPRDLTDKKGANKRSFSFAPAYQQLNLCNIHFHKNAEHKGGEFTAATAAAGHGGEHGHQAGYQYAGKLSAAESKPLADEVCKSEHGGLQVGDTVELHYVHSSAQVTPGRTLNACLSEADANPQLRVEAQVFVLVNNPRAADFGALTQVGERKGYQQALNIPKNSGPPIQYAGSTTGPTYNEKGSPLQVSWSVRPRVVKVYAASVGKWCEGNVFKEDHGHGVRNLVVNESLLSRMS